MVYKRKAFTPLENLRRLFKRAGFSRETKAFSSLTGFTLVELVMTMVIIGIISVVGAWIMFYFIQNAMFAPNQLNMDMAVSDAMKMMVDGDDTANGLRFSRQITAVAGSSDITFVNQDNQTIRYYLSGGSLYRTINGGAAELFPYYANAGVAMSAKSGTLFTYYDVNEAATVTPANIRRVVIGLVAQTGTGNYSDWQGKSDQMSSVKVDKYQ